MSTNRDMISRVRSTHKLFGDSSLNDRSIWRELFSNSKGLLKQYLEKRKLWNVDTIFTTIPCMEMEQVPIADCCDYTSTKLISRSKFKLPSIATGIFDYAIQGVYDVSSSMALKYMPINRYINSLKLGLKTKETYYWITNDRIYVSSPYVLSVKLVAFFEDGVPNEIMYPECGCEGKESSNPCNSPLDSEFKTPGFLESTIVDMTSRSLLQSYFRIQVDQTSDSKDDQVNKV